ncbi:MAG: chondroitinase family polysaccharide lyase, partial [Desulfobacteraceae bacterium]|nr:chondroitinase family polysaccharide lyase [Desulfobacteraceae bacterium]
MNFMKKGMLSILLTIGVMVTSSQNRKQLSPLNNLDFEKTIPSFVSVSKGEISLSSNQRVSGSRALKWSFVPGDVLTITGEIGYQPQEVVKQIEILGDLYPVTNDPVLFKLPFYSEKALATTLRVQFGRGEHVDCFIDIILGFEGWRKFVIPYDRGHMRGKPQPGMDFMRIEVLGEESSTLYFDNPVFAFRENPRGIKANPLVPTLKNHPQRFDPNGSFQFQHWQLEKPWFPLQEMVSTDQQEAFRIIENRLYELEWGGRKEIPEISKSKMDNLKEKYRYFGITRDGKWINGLHLDKRGDRTKINKLVKSIGIAYRQVQNQVQKDELAQMVVNLIEHAINVDNKINWYDGRGFADGCYLLKEELKRVGLFQNSIDFLRRKYAFPRFYNEDVINGRHGNPSFNSDEIYTNSIGFILCVLMMDESPEKVRNMQHLISFYSNVAFNYSNGLTDTFKPDGSHYHHANAALTRYGAYTMSVVSEVIRILSKTEFRIYEEAHERMKHNVLVRRFYRTKDWFPYAFSHNRIRPLNNQNFDDSRHLALAGTPDGKKEIDKEMAAVYLRMMDGDQLPEDAKVFEEMGIQPEKTPQGHHTLSYHAKSIHRKNDWMAVVGAHSRYIYQKENWSWHATRGNVKFGMFENWGSLELIYPDKPGLDQVDNGRTLEGWDWTKIPGVTSINA